MAIDSPFPVGYVGEVDRVLLAPTHPFVNSQLSNFLNASSPIANGHAIPNCPGGQFSYNPVPEQQRPFMRLPFDRMEPEQVIVPQSWYGHFPGFPFDARIEDIE